MQVEILEVAGIEPMLAALRLPMKSGEQSDSVSGVIGSHDRELLMRLLRAGSSHSKAVRLPVVYLAITARKSWWQQFDTYRYDVQMPTDYELEADWEACSESAMHTLAKEVEAEVEWLSHLAGDYDEPSTAMMQRFEVGTSPFCVLSFVLAAQSDGFDIDRMRSNLPEGFLQKRVGRMSYITARNIYHDRRKHKMPEWKRLCNALASLPAGWLITDD